MYLSIPGDWCDSESCAAPASDTGRVQVFNPRYERVQQGMHNTFTSFRITIFVMFFGFKRCRFIFQSATFRVLSLALLTPFYCSIQALAFVEAPDILDMLSCLRDMLVVFTTPASGVAKVKKTMFWFLCDVAVGE